MTFESAALREELASGNRRQQRDLIAVMQDCVALRELFVYGNVESPIKKTWQTALEKIANCGSFG